MSRTTTKVNATQGKAWRLESLTIRKFRGVSGERTYVFGGKPGLLHGPNGVGKSTAAQALQWTLFGELPAEAFPKAGGDRFLTPVSLKGKPFECEVVLARGGGERCVVTRAASDFKVAVGGEELEGDEAAAKLEAVLGLDQDTFTRAVLLQQSRIRGLLLDDPKERNHALDRLIGLEDAERLLEVLRPKDFSGVADDCRAEAEEAKARLAERRELLEEQRKEAEARARELKFLVKDQTPSGLRERYEALSADLAKAGTKYGVKVEPLPPCKTVDAAQAAGAAFARGLQAIRTRSEVRSRLAPLQKEVAKLEALASSWKDAHAAASQAKAALATLVETHGSPGGLADERAQLEVRIKSIVGDLKAADELRQLLQDARAFVEATHARRCPVCEQDVSNDLGGRLDERLAGEGSAKTAALEKALAESKARREAVESALRLLQQAAKGVEDARKALEKVGERAREALGGSPVPEEKVAARLAEAEAKASKEIEKLEAQVEAMEHDLEALELRAAALKEGLVPVLAKREELARHEKREQEAKARFADAEARAEALDERAAQVDAIRKALLEAKQELAEATLAKAKKRTQELYEALVAQPVFDTIDIDATAKANKVDYAFTVSSAGAEKTRREARLVLSDGQITATALGLFFALADSTSHALDVLYVDDPTQNLDPRAKEAMAKVVADLARRRQVVVSSHDPDFVAFLESEGFFDLAVVHHLKSWDGTPEVETVTS